MEDEDINYTIKQRLKIVKLNEKEKESLEKIDDLMIKIEEQNIKLQKLRELEEKCLVEIEEEAEERVRMAMEKLTKAGQFMADMEKKATLIVQTIKSRSKQSQDAILGLLGMATELVDKSEHLKEQSEKVTKVILKAQEDLNGRIQANSEFEEMLKKRKKEVEIKNKKADQKLKEAKDLAFWHKEPGAKYPQK